MPPGDGEVFVQDTKLLRTLAGLFDDWEEKDLRAGVVGVDGVTITPGTFPEATQLKTTVEERATQLASVVDKLAGRLTGIANNLRDSADQYDKDNDTNEDAAKGIDWNKTESKTANKTAN
jgi:hypothetical protein